MYIPWLQLYGVYIICFEYFSKIQNYTDTKKVTIEIHIP